MNKQLRRPARATNRSVSPRRVSSFVRAGLCLIIVAVMMSLFTTVQSASAATANGYLPFPAGTTVHVFQGNGPGNGCTTHCTQPDLYAWDFGASSGSSAGMAIVSATSGTVIGLRNSYQGTCNNFFSSCAFGNYVFVHNDDGTYLEYLHLQPGSVVVSQNQHIVVGQPVGQIGATGYTGGFAHLHFSWLSSASGTGNSPSVGNSIPGSFTGIGNPTIGQNLVSNNLGGTPPTSPAARAGMFVGDGKADLIAVNDSSSWVMPSTGTGFAAPVAWSSSAFYGTKATLVADVNGDGKADLIAVNDNNTFVMLSTGTGFAAPVAWSSSAFYGTKATLVADVNGDGKADLIAVNDNNTFVMLSTGTGFAAPVAWSSSAFYGTKATLVADVNGDGKADLIAVNDNNTFVMLSTGTGFAAPVAWSSSAFYGTKATLVADVNGDGKADLIAVNDNNTFVMLSTGTGFAAPVAWSSSAFYGTKVTLVADVNGDGKADLIAVNDNNTFVMLSTGTGFAAPVAWSSSAFYGTR